MKATDSAPAIVRLARIVPMSRYHYLAKLAKPFYAEYGFYNWNASAWIADGCGVGDTADEAKRNAIADYHAKMALPHIPEDSLGLGTSHPFPTLHKDGSVEYLADNGTAIVRAHPGDLPDYVKRTIGYELLNQQHKRAAKAKLPSPRFVWAIGAYAEQFPDMPGDLPVCLYDRQDKRAVVTLAGAYANAICLEFGNDAPFTKLETWFNSLSDSELTSEGMTATANRYVP